MRAFLQNRFVRTSFLAVAAIIGLQLFTDFARIWRKSPPATKHSVENVIPEEKHQIHLDMDPFYSHVSNEAIVSLPGNATSVPSQRFIDGKLKKDHICQDSVARPQQTLYRNKVWQYIQQDNAEIFTYAAYYDDRPVVGLLPWLRLHLIEKRTKDTKYCHVWYNDFPYPYITEVIMNKTGRDYRINRVSYGQSLYSCLLPAAYPIPTHVSIATKRCGNSTIYQPISHQPRAPWVHEFGICVAIAFGSIPVPAFVEWMEFHNMYGIAEFNVYDGDMKNMTEVFDYYKNLGLLRVHPMPPAVNVTSYDSVKLNSPCSINDCMLRNMYRYRFALIIDFDEFMTPRMHSNYHDMLQYIDEKDKRIESHHTYTARNTYFFQEFPPDELQPHYLISARYRKHTKPNGSGFAPKSFMDPRRCFSAFNHYCWIRFPNQGPGFIGMDPNVVRSHHYRKCGFGTAKCEEWLKDDNLDDIALGFKPTLQRRVVKVLTDLGYKAS